MSAETEDRLIGTVVTSEHRGAPRFDASLRALIGGIAEAADLGRTLAALHDLDAAVGDQLDTVGLWVGVTRRVPIPLAGMFFTWSGTVDTGWARGQWKGPTDPGTGIVELSDADFRLFIRAKIAANSWDSSMQQIKDILDFLFPFAVSMRDNQDGTARIIYNTARMSAVQQALLTGDLLALRPAGITYIYQAF